MLPFIFCNNQDHSYSSHLCVFYSFLERRELAMSELFGDEVLPLFSHPSTDDESRQKLFILSFFLE
jgi:hypothetical protein